jgi:hypothetical protein
MTTGRQDYAVGKSQNVWACEIVWARLDFHVEFPLLLRFAFLALFFHVHS